MTYNGIGLVTPRGSGTNGYIQSNKAFVKFHKDRVEYQTTEEDIARYDRQQFKKPNEEILNHQRKRKVELKCMEMEELMEEQGYTAEEIESKVSAFRKMLMDKEGVAQSAERQIEKDSENRPVVTNSHQAAEATEWKNSTFKSALGLTEAFKDGSSLERMAMQDQKRSESMAKAKYEMVESDSDGSRSSSPTPKKKRKKHKKERSESESPERKDKKHKKKSKKHKRDSSVTDDEEVEETEEKSPKKQHKRKHRKRSKRKRKRDTKLKKYKLSSSESEAEEEEEEDAQEMCHDKTDEEKTVTEEKDASENEVEKSEESQDSEPDSSSEEDEGEDDVEDEEEDEEDEDMATSITKEEVSSGVLKVAETNNNTEDLVSSPSASVKLTEKSTVNANVVSTSNESKAPDAEKEDKKSRDRHHRKRGRRSRSKSSHRRSRNSRHSRRSKRSRSHRRRSQSHSHSRSRSPRSFTRSPSIRRRRGSPSHLDRRRITSARKRPIPYYRPTPPGLSSESDDPERPRGRSSRRRHKRRH